MPPRPTRPRPNCLGDSWGESAGVSGGSARRLSAGREDEEGERVVGERAGEP